MRKLKFDKKTTITAMICIVIVAVALYFLVIRKGKEAKASASPTDAPTPSGSDGVRKYIDQSFPLKRNSGGDRVSMLQTKLNEHCASGLEVDGKFGEKTEAAVLSRFGHNYVTESEYYAFCGYVAV